MTANSFCTLVYAFLVYQPQALLILVRAAERQQSALPLRRGFFPEVIADLLHQGGRQR
jgi:hypothetical protein